MSAYGTASIGSLHGTSSSLSKTDEAMRLDDYLNDKIQTTSDLRGLASLIANVEDQRKSLEEQVSLEPTSCVFLVLMILSCSFNKHELRYNKLEMHLRITPPTY